ncbi:MAG: FAD-binding oxidoreductase [Pseudomonadota bacterium]
MAFNSLAQADIDFFRSLFGPERFSTGESVLNLHSRDQSHHGPYFPEAVIWPETVEEVQRSAAHANHGRLPLTGWGSGSSLEGNPLPVNRGVVVDFSRMNRILAIRPEDFQADVEPGVIYQDLNEKLRSHGLFFPPDPGARATLGGMIANNSSGTRTVKYGATRDYVLRLEIVLADGELIATGARSAKTSSGYDLVDLFVGSEGTLGLVVGATVGLAGAPEEFSAAVVSFEQIAPAGQAVFEIMRAGLDPAALELLDLSTVLLLNREEKLDLAPTPALLMEFHGPSKAYLNEVLSLAREICQAHGGTGFRAGLGRDERDRLWHARHKAGEIMIRVHPGAPPLIVDTAVPLSAYPEMIALCDELVRQSGVPGYIFSHAGDGNIHVVLMGRVGNRADWDAIEKVNEAVVRRALDLGGTATGEHGVGLGKKKFMVQEHGRSWDWMKRIKTLFDPNGILNPGKMF